VLLCAALLCHGVGHAQSPPNASTKPSAREEVAARHHARCGEADERCARAELLAACRRGGHCAGPQWTAEYVLALAEQPQLVGVAAELLARSLLRHPLEPALVSPEHLALANAPEASGSSLARALEQRCLAGGAPDTAEQHRVCVAAATAWMRAGHLTRIAHVLRAVPAQSPLGAQAEGMRQWAERALQAADPLAHAHPSPAAQEPRSALALEPAAELRHYDQSVQWLLAHVEATPAALALADEVWPQAAPEQRALVLLAASQALTARCRFAEARQLARAAAAEAARERERSARQLAPAPGEAAASAERKRQASCQAPPNAAFGPFDRETLEIQAQQQCAEALAALHATSPESRERAKQLADKTAAQLTLLAELASEDARHSELEQLARAEQWLGRLRQAGLYRLRPALPPATSRAPWREVAAALGSAATASDRAARHGFAHLAALRVRQPGTQCLAEPRE
jgi:hypothetical protein